MPTGLFTTIDATRRPARPALRAIALASALIAVANPPTLAGSVDFRRDVLPVLSDHCFRCHGPDAKTRKAGLRLDLKDGVVAGKEAVVVPGKSAESELIARVSSADPEEVMPPPGSGKALSKAQVETLKRWVDEGAEWSQHWAFEPVRPLVPPAARDADGERNPIDRFVRARLAAEGLSPSPEAEKTTLIRRVTLDLTGLPPTLAEVDAFLADHAPGAYERVVDRLLASPAYGERMAWDWLDAARYADTNGYQNDFARTMWPWRDWVVGAFNANLPFDRFVVEQVAGDLVPGATLAQKVATGFNRNNRTVTEAGSIDEEWRIENAVDRVETTATVLLGLTMGCARCHDHKYDPVSQTEFYRFLAFFNSVNEKGVYTETRGNVPPMVKVPTPADEARLRAVDAELADAKKGLEAVEAALPERLKSWEREVRSAGAEVPRRDWTLRFPLDGSLGVFGPDLETGKLDYREGKPPTWVEGPIGRALSLPGAEGAFARGPSPGGFERTDRFSYGGWVRSRGDGAVLSKMDEHFRGFDLIISGEKLEVHLVHAWPGDAVKVETRTGLPKGRWSHVLVTYDGSGKAAGVVVYLDGRPVPVDVKADSLRNSIQTPEPIRVGSRAKSSPFQGDLADLRVYARTLNAKEAEEVATDAVVSAARLEVDRRNEVQRALLTQHVRERLSTDWKAANDRLASLKSRREEAEKAVPTVMVMEDTANPRPTYVLKRGRYDAPDTSKTLEPDVPACLPPLPADAPRNRLGLARWLVSPKNPLTPRVIVNRLWQQHFGAGLVKTAENFGIQSELPSHPELLDWLAAEFVRQNWDLKAMHRLMVTSATYRQTSKAAAETHQRDPENRWLSRGPRFRLPAEAVRDNALAVSGLLTWRVGGPSVKPYQPAGLWEELAGGAGEPPYVQEKGPNLYRRSLYIYRKRTVPHPVMANFDAPSREVCQVKRPRTNTPLQALELLNDVTYVEAARRLAERMIAEGGAEPSERIAHGFRRATARKPSSAELQALTRGLERYRALYGADRAAAEAFVRTGESPVAKDADPAELAAYTAVAGVILNLDETITRE